MAHTHGSILLNASLHVLSRNDTTDLHNVSHHSIPQNVSIPEGCGDIIFMEMEHHGEEEDEKEFYVSKEAETIIRKTKDSLLTLLFLIGGPANVINMAVFSKQGLKDRVNLCLFTLSLTDELHLIMGMLHHGEQLHLQFTSDEKFGPIDTFLTNNNLLGLTSFNYISYILSAIIAIERCLCVLNPLRFQTLLRTRTLGCMIAAVYALALALNFILSFKYRIGCVYDLKVGEVIKTGVVGEFYSNNKEFIDYLDSFMFGAGLPGVVVIVVIVTTTLTTMKLREVVNWRAGASSAISPHEVALTKMLVGNSVLFLVCLSPVAAVRVSWLFFPRTDCGDHNLSFFLASLWVTECFTYINATFNIFVYYAMGSRYRETLWALCGKRTQLKENEK